MKNLKLLMRIFTLMIGSCAIAQTPVGSDFTYQGELTQNNQAPSGAYDFEVSAYDALTNGTLYAAPLNLNAIQVDKGLFVLSLDFGDVTFIGNEVYLQIKVQKNGSGAALIPLSPRQKLTSAPYVTYSQFVGLNAVTQTEILDESINPQDLANNSITSAKLAVNSVTSSDIQNSAIIDGKIAMGAVGAAAINAQIQERVGDTCANGSYLKGINSDGSVICALDTTAPMNVTSAEIVDATIATVDLANNSITSVKLADNSVNAIALASESITSSQISNNSINASDINSGDIQLRIDFTCSNTRFINAIFEDGSVNCPLENDGPIIVTSQEIVDGSIASIDFSDNAIENTHLANNSVTANTLSSGAIDASKVIDSQVQLRINSTCEDGTFVTGFNQDGSVICQLLPISLDFLLDSNGNTGEHTSLVVSPTTGLPIISYYEQGFGDLKILFCNNIHCTSGVVKVLDTNFEVGQYNSIALATGTEYPLVSYFDNTNKDLKLYVCEDTDCSSGTIRVLDSAGNVGRYSSIMFNPTGFILISYYDSTNKNLKGYACTNATCSLGSSFAMVSSGDVGRFSSLKLRPISGFPMISYKDDTNGSLNVFNCTNPNCTLGNEQGLDASANVGDYSSIAINNLGNPVISYHDSSTNDLKLFSCTNSNCTSGLDVTLDTQGDVGSHTSITIDPVSNYPIISYYDATNTALKIYNCSHVNCVTGESKFIDYFGDVGEYSSIGIGSEGNPIISYYDLSNGALKVFNCTNAGCD